MKAALFLQKTLGQKVVLGLTGLGLCFFILIHMLGNLLILSGPREYNLYAQRLHEIKIIELLELGLLFFFVSHILLSVFVQIKNRLAKGRNYYKKASGHKKTSLANRLLILQGGVILVFLVIHLLTFKFGTYYEVVIDGKATRDIYRLVVESFQSPIFLGGYSVSLLVLAIHIIHGLPASIKSLGFNHPNYTPWVEKFSWVFGGGVTIGFLVPLVYIHWFL